MSELGLMELQSLADGMQPDDHDHDNDDFLMDAAIGLP